MSHEDLDLPETPRDRVRSRSAFVTGVMISLAVHATVLLILALITFTVGGGRSDAQGDLAVDFALMSDASLSGMNANAIEADTPSVEAAEDMSVEVTLAVDGESADLAFDPTEIGDLSLGSSGGSVGDGGGLDGGGGVSGDGASFFGVEASGRRFFYIVDTSGSMMTPRDTPKIERLKAELSRSVRSLGAAAEYIIALFASNTDILEEPLGWRPATDRNRARTIGRIAELEAMGGTQPLGAFELAFQVEPQPDAIYFMTDAEAIDQSLSQQIQSLNRRAKVPVHCILFNTRQQLDRSSDLRTLLERIARESGGSYTSVAVGG